MNKSSKLPIPYKTHVGKQCVDQLAVNALLDDSETFKQGDTHPKMDLIYRYKAKNNTPYWVTPEVYDAYVKNNKAKKREWRRAHNEIHLERKRKWRKANPEKHNSQQARRRAQRFGADVDEFGVSHYTDYDRSIMEQLYAHARRLKDILGNNWEIDHVLPLNCGGSNRISNLQLTPASWNSSKGDRNTNIYGAWKARPDYSFFNK